MRGLAFAAIVLGCGAATGACAQAMSSLSTSYEFPRADAAALNAAAFAPQSFTASVDPVGAAIDRHETFTAAGDPLRWNSSEVQLGQTADGAVNSLRLSVGGALRPIGGAPLNPHDAAFDAEAYEMTLIRNWPSAVSFSSRTFAVDVTPHAGVGVSNVNGGSLEAGAMVRLSARKSRDERAKEKLQEMGVSDGAAFGDRGRWYLFAATSGRAVGLNMLRGDSGWNRAGWTTDSTSALVGDAQVGVGWRKGAMQSSVGYVHREVKGEHMIWGQQTRNDSMVAFSLSIRPQF